MSGRDKLMQVIEMMGDEDFIKELIVAMSEKEAEEMAEHMDRMYDLNLFEEEE
jgi:hypothetical protein